MAATPGHPVDQPVDGERAPVDRLVGGDRMQWEADVGPFPQHIGAVLMLDEVAGDSAQWAEFLADRLGRVPALGRRPVRPGLGGGPWVWVDDDRDPAAHVTVARLPDRSRGCVLSHAVSLAGARMTPGLSPWRACVLTGPDGAVVAIVVLLHHALADGLAGLAVLGALLDGPRAPSLPPARGLPDRADLVRDAWARRWAAVRRLPSAVRQVPGAWEEMRSGRGARAPRTALNRPTGGRRDLDVVQVAIAPVRDAAHRAGGSVNDALLVAVAGALSDVAGHRGEHLGELVVSVPVAVTDPAVRARVGNAVGAVPMPVGTRGPARERIAAVAARRRAALAGSHGRSLALILAAFRVLSTLRLVGTFTTRQRLVTTFVTNVRGPDERLRVDGAGLDAIVPLVANQGNQSVSFAALGYAGVLTVAVTTDPDLGIAAAEVAHALRSRLDEITAG